MTGARLPFGDDPPWTGVPPGTRAPAADAPAPVETAAPQPATRPARQVLTVSQLTAQIRLKLESAWPTVWVEGELSNARRWKTGHLYFTLKAGNAQIRGVMFRSAVRTLRFEPEDGLLVVARGRVSVYEPKGEYQLVAEHFEPAGVGARQLAFDQLRQRLEREGLFAAERKRALPMLPRRIGIVTSRDGAALHDILTVLGRRFPTAHLVISPARVQGDGAARELTAALGRLARVTNLDVVIIGRGGGSVEDLWAFNDETLARAIATCPAPVISAVGHETDYTISDFVADLRAATPSAAAEIVVARKADLEGRIVRAADRLVDAARDGLRARRGVVERAERRPGMAALPARLALVGRQVSELADWLGDAVRGPITARTREVQALRQRLDQLDVGVRLARIQTALALADSRLARSIGDRSAARRRQMDAALARLERAVGERTTVRRGRLETAAAQLAALSPLGVLARGYAVCWNRDRTAIVRRAQDIRAGDAVRVTLHEGELRCDVQEITGNGRHG